MASKKSIDYFYDVVSPYSWFAFEVLCRYQSRWNFNLKLRPFFLGGIMDGTGNKPPAMVPAKAVYGDRDTIRLAKYFEIPLNLPADPADVMFVKGTLKTQRFLTALDMRKPDMVEAMSRELWMRAWNRDEDIAGEDSLAEAAEKIGVSKELIQSILASMREKGVKDQLKATTQEALDLGAFGSPIIVFDHNGQKDWIFGSDRFPILAMMLGKKWEGPNPGSSTASKL